ncbi:hypothetical protein ACI2OX_10450 [Bacillus sp. N9]
MDKDQKYTPYESVNDAEKSIKTLSRVELHGHKYKKEKLVKKYG